MSCYLESASNRRPLILNNYWSNRLVFSLKFTLTTFLSDIGPLLTHVSPNRSKRQNSSRCRQRLERERTIESASEPIKPVVPGGEPITLDFARVK